MERVYFSIEGIYKNNKKAFICSANMGINSNEAFIRHNTAFINERIGIINDSNTYIQKVSVFKKFVLFIAEYDEHDYLQTKKEVFTTSTQVIHQFKHYLGYYKSKYKIQ